MPVIFRAKKIGRSVMLQGDAVGSMLSYCKMRHTPARLVARSNVKDVGPHRIKPQH